MSSERFDFKASVSCFEELKKISRIPFVVCHSEFSFSDKVAADKFKGEFSNLIESGNYLPEQVFNCNNTVFFKCPLGSL